MYYLSSVLYWTEKDNCASVATCFSPFFPKLYYINYLHNVNCFLIGIMCTFYNLFSFSLLANTTWMLFLCKFEGSEWKAYMIFPSNGMCYAQMTFLPLAPPGKYKILAKTWRPTLDVCKTFIHFNIRKTIIAHLVMSVSWVTFESHFAFSFFFRSFAFIVGSWNFFFFRKTQHYLEF